MDSWPWCDFSAALNKEEDDMNVKGLIGGGVALGALFACGAANAGGVSFGINVGVPAPVYAAPVYVAPQPVYAPPPPPVYAPPPPPPVAYAQPAPVYAAPAPVVVAAPGPVVVVGWHGDRYWDGYRYWNRRDWYAYHGGHYGYRHW
jgi:hypothetical protein